MEQPACFFRALADPTRLRIVNLLLRTSLCVCEMERILELSQPLLSRHLAYLRNCGLAESRRDGMRVNYNLNTSHPLLRQFRPLLRDALGHDAVGSADLRRLKTVISEPGDEGNKTDGIYTETYS
jgi:ArsR family transcriptional regulator